MNFARNVYDILKGSRLLMAGSVVCGLLFAGANLIPPLLIRRLIQWVTEGGTGADDLAGVTVLLLGVYVVRGATRYGYGYFSHVTAYRVMHVLMNRVYVHLQGLPHRFFNKQRTGNLITRSVNDIEAVEDFIAHGIPETILAMIIPLSMMVVLFMIDVELALIVLLPVPLAAWIVYRFVSKVRLMWRTIRERLSEFVALVQDNLSGIALIKAFTQERGRAALVQERSDQFRDEMIRANTISLMPSGVLEATGGLGVVLVIWWGGEMALSERISVADLFVFIVYLGHIYQPFLALASINDVLQKAAASTDRVFQLLDEKSEITDAPDAVAPKSIAYDIEFRNVTFAYEATPVLTNVSFRVEPGEVVALVGPTGAGKTTVSSLIPRFYDVQGGSVKVGGHDVRFLQLHYLRGRIASVLQDVFLFHGTVRDNIHFGRPNAADDEVVKATRAANAEPFILDLPDGYDTIIGERGVRLSGGQKQRLSIARAILRDAPILILDEATSSVDAETEALIQSAINRLARHRTSVVIAHRLSTIRNADKIIVLDAGEIVEVGTHDKLMSQNGLYARMVQSQDPSRDWRIHGEALMGPPTDAPQST